MKAKGRSNFLASFQARVDGEVSATSGPPRSPTSRGPGKSVEQSLFESILCNPQQVAPATSSNPCANHPKTAASFAVGRGSGERHLCRGCALFEELRLGRGTRLSAEQSYKASKIFQLHSEMEELRENISEKAGAKEKVERHRLAAGEALQSAERAAVAALASYFAAAKGRLDREFREKESRAEEIQVEAEKLQRRLHGFLDDLLVNFASILACIDLPNFEELFDQTHRELDTIHSDLQRIEPHPPVSLPSLNPSVLTQALDSALCLHKSANSDCTTKTPSSPADPELCFDEPPRAASRRSATPKTQPYPLSRLRPQTEPEQPESPLRARLKKTRADLRSTIVKLCDDVHRRADVKKKLESALSEISGLVSPESKFGKLSRIDAEAPVVPRLNENIIKGFNNGQELNSARKAHRDSPNLFAPANHFSSAKSAAKPALYASAKQAIRLVPTEPLLYRREDSQTKNRLEPKTDDPSKPFIAR